MSTISEGPKILLFSEDAHRKEHCQSYFIKCSFVPPQLQLNENSFILKDPQLLHNNYFVQNIIAKIYVYTNKLTLQWFVELE